MSLEDTFSRPQADREARKRPPIWRLTRKRRNMLFFLLIAVVIVLILETPLIYMIASSFKPAVEVYRVPPAFFPSQWVWDGYRELLELSDMVKAIQNSVKVATVASTLGVGLSVGFCYAVTRFNFPGMRFFTVLMLATAVLFTLVARFCQGTTFLHAEQPAVAGTGAD